MRVFDCQIKILINQKSQVLICDGFRTHETLKILKFCLKNNIFLCRLSFYTFHKLQSCDVEIFSSLKTVYRDEVERLYREELDTLDKKHFTSLYKPARKRALNKKNILTGWIVIDLFPFDSKRVLRYTPKFSIEISVSKANEMMSFSQGQILQSPITSVTSITIKAFTSLHNLIKQKACALNESDKQRIQKHVQKLASAAQVSYAKQILLQDQNRFLIKINNEVRARRSTRSMILKKAKMLNYENLEETRAERAAKEKATIRKNRRKRERKRKSSALQKNSSVSTNDLMLKSTKTSVSWKVSEARMY